MSRALSLAGFQVTLIGRIWVTPEATWNFPPEIRAIWHAAPNLTLCPKFHRASLDKLLTHIKSDKCKRCLAVYQQLDRESELICFLMNSRN